MSTLTWFVKTNKRTLEDETSKHFLRTRSLMTDAGFFGAVCNPNIYGRCNYLLSYSVKAVMRHL